MNDQPIRHPRPAGRARAMGRSVPCTFDLPAPLYAAIDRARGRLTKKALIEEALEKHLASLGHWPPAAG